MKSIFLRTILSIVVLIGQLNTGLAQHLPSAGALPQSSGVSTGALPILRGLKIVPHQPYEFDFIVDPQVNSTDAVTLERQSQSLVRYFLAALTMPEQDMWVNLSPHEPDRIINEDFGKTLMGRDLLEQDYLLKQLSASLLHPDDDAGQAFWNRVYAQAFERYGTTDIPMDTFHKIWISPKQATLYEKNGAVYIQDASMKVMLERDYLAGNHRSSVISKMSENQQLESERVSTTMMKSIIIPLIEEEVNQGDYFAKLRQIYHAMILAHWYKTRIQQHIFDDAFVDARQTRGVEFVEGIDKTQLYQQYLTTLKQGVYDLIREESYADEQITRHYFSGGFGLTDQGMASIVDYASEARFDSNQWSMRVNVDHAHRVKSTYKKFTSRSSATNLTVIRSLLEAMLRMRNSNSDTSRSIVAWSDELKTRSGFRSNKITKYKKARISLADGTVLSFKGLVEGETYAYDIRFSDKLQRYLLAWVDESDEELLFDIIGSKQGQVVFFPVGLDGKHHKKNSRVKKALDDFLKLYVKSEVSVETIKNRVRDFNKQKYVFDRALDLLMLPQLGIKLIDLNAAEGDVLRLEYDAFLDELLVVNHNENYPYKVYVLKKEDLKNRKIIYRPSDLAREYLRYFIDHRYSLSQQKIRLFNRKKLKFGVRQKTKKEADSLSLTVNDAVWTFNFKKSDEFFTLKIYGSDLGFHSEEHHLTQIYELPQHTEAKRVELMPVRLKRDEALVATNDTDEGLSSSSVDDHAQVVERSSTGINKEKMKNVLIAIADLNGAVSNDEYVHRIDQEINDYKNYPFKTRVIAKSGSFSISFSKGYFLVFLGLEPGLAYDVDVYRYGADVVVTFSNREKRYYFQKSLSSLREKVQEGVMRLQFSVSVMQGGYNGVETLTNKGVLREVLGSMLVMRDQGKNTSEDIVVMGEELTKRRGFRSKKVSENKRTTILLNEEVVLYFKGLREGAAYSYGVRYSHALQRHLLVLIDELGTEVFFDVSGSESGQVTFFPVNIEGDRFKTNQRLRKALDDFLVFYGKEKIEIDNIKKRISEFNKQGYVFDRGVNSFDLPNAGIFLERFSASNGALLTLVYDDFLDAVMIKIHNQDESDQFFLLNQKTISQKMINSKKELNREYLRYFIQHRSNLSKKKVSLFNEAKIKLNAHNKESFSVKVLGRHWVFHYIVLDDFFMITGKISKGGVFLHFKSGNKPKSQIYQLPSDENLYTKRAELNPIDVVSDKALAVMNEQGVLLGSVDDHALERKPHDRAQGQRAFRTREVLDANEFVFSKDQGMVSSSIHDAAMLLPTNGGIDLDPASLSLNIQEENDLAITLPDVAMVGLDHKGDFSGVSFHVLSVQPLPQVASFFK